MQLISFLCNYSLFLSAMAWSCCNVTQQSILIHYSSANKFVSSIHSITLPLSSILAPPIKIPGHMVVVVVIIDIVDASITWRTRGKIAEQIMQLLTDTTRLRLICDKICAVAMGRHHDSSITECFCRYFRDQRILTWELSPPKEMSSTRDRANSWCAINWAEIGVQLLLLMGYPEVSAGWPQHRQT